ncbi:TIGR00270 family protein [Candidatus Woesearchaeota archaeon CG10_big_fil_rev_8_21_14_0_10_32_9]|nr:MAG: TIGR00270 family protein [Candidatus Woesearchaeota archaeon CG10_big_fil_rev_8_21_14_0_10_32_9]
MCGREGQLFDADVEGSVLVVCTSCTKFGTVLRKHAEEKYVSKYVETKKKEEESKPVNIIVSNYASLIKKSREKRGLKQDEFAKLLQEKESAIQHLESGKLEPSIVLAEKIEKQLKIKLIEVYREPVIAESSTETTRGPLTIGDLIKFKKK